MKHTIHDPKLFGLPYPRNLMLAIAKADLIDPETKELKPPVINIDAHLEEFATTVPLERHLTPYEARVIVHHYKYGLSLAEIATYFGCTSENIRTRRNHALNKLLKTYLEWRAPKGFKTEELNSLYSSAIAPFIAKIDSSSSPEVISKIEEQLNKVESTSLKADTKVLPEQVPKHIKAAKNSIKHRKVHKRVKQVIPYKFYIRSDGVLYVEIKDEIAQHYIGEFYSYSNSCFSIDGIIIDISIAGILLTDWEVKHK